MTQQELIEKIKSKIIVACPEITVRNTSVLIGEPFRGIVNYHDDSIGIAEILRTLKKQNRKVPTTLSDHGDILDTEKDNVVWWDLEQDRIEDQLLETLMFLWELLKDL